MAKFLGLLPTDVFGVSAPEVKAGVLSFTATEMAGTDEDGILVETETSQSAETVVTTFLKQPPCPRQITVKAKSTDAGEVTADSTVKIEGTNVAGESIEETLTFEADQSGAETTESAFKTVTKITFSAQADGTPAFNVGWNDVIGLPFKFASKPFFFEKFGGAMQFTAGTLTIDADDIEKNVYDPNGSLDGQKDLELLMFF